MPNEGYVKHDRITCFCGDDFALIYNYTGRSFSIDCAKLRFEPDWYMWYDPTTGEFNECDFDIRQSCNIEVPKNHRNETDMVLVVSDIDRNNADIC